MVSQNILKSKNFLIYGLGLTGQSVCQFLKKSRTKNIFLWDDNRNLRKKFKIKENLRFRKEEDFYLINIQWGNTISVNNQISEFI